MTANYNPIDKYHRVNSLHSRRQTLMRDVLYERFSSKITHNPDLNRTLVSFQANKQVPFYRWFKYKEGFSRDLVHYLVQNLSNKPGVLLDPFAGTGSALFASAEMGWKAKGIELLPVGVYAMKARVAANRISPREFELATQKILSLDFRKEKLSQYAFNHIAITEGAFSEEDEEQLIGFISSCHQHVTDDDIRTLLLYAAFTILEEMSYTRKDGQYLRWDARSGRSRTNFNKGHISSFQDAIEKKLYQMIDDFVGLTYQLPLFEDDTYATSDYDFQHQIEISSGSCLDLLPMHDSESIDFVLTSPPYVNRYDYTRTYALELVFLGCSDAEVKELRQTMLSCTVENKDKRDFLNQLYTNLGRREDFEFINKTFENQGALQEVLSILEEKRQNKMLNNPHLLRLVHNYFYEMAFVIFELTRVLRLGGTIAMVNDNVRYAGEEVPVDIILSAIAEEFGLTTQNIWTLGRGKGNSSQQMGNHGRSELRKCVYVWQKNR